MVAPPAKQLVAPPAKQFSKEQLAELDEEAAAAEKGLKNPSVEDLLNEGLNAYNKPCLGRIYTVNQETEIKSTASERSKTLKTLPAGSRIICFSNDDCEEPDYIYITEEEGDEGGYMKYYDFQSNKALITDTGIFATFKDPMLDAALKHISIQDFHNKNFREAIRYLWTAIELGISQGGGLVLIWFSVN